MSFLRTVLGPENALGVDGGARCVLGCFFFVCSKYTFLKKLTQALKRSHPNRSCGRRDLFTKNVMLVAVTLGAASETFYMKKPAKKTFRKKNHSNPSIFPTHSFTNTCKNHQIASGAPYLIALQTAATTSTHPSDRKVSCPTR